MLSRMILLGLAMLGVASAFVPSFGGASLMQTPSLRAASIRRCGLAVTMNSDRVSEINEVMVELKEFRQRIVNDATELAKKVKAKPRDLRKTLESQPDLIKIDQALEQLEAELKELSASPA